MPDQSTSKPIHVVLTSHARNVYQNAIPVHWGAKDPIGRGPIVASPSQQNKKNAIGSHSGSYTVYRALATAAGALKSDHKPDLTNTTPFVEVPPQPSWFDSKKIVSMDPWGADICKYFKTYLDQGVDIRPTVAVTKAHMHLPEIQKAIEEKKLQVDGKILTPEGGIVVTKVAVEPVWYLPGIAERFKVSEPSLRTILYQQTCGMFPELVTRPDLKVLLPPIGGSTIYIFGNPSFVSDPSKALTIRVHDECNGSDVFGSDICTCRPYLIHGIEEAVKSAQDGGAGVIVYHRKEGRSLGEVTKFLVYNARKRQEGGDSAATYFYRTECVAGVQDMRFQELMPDTLHWLGVTKIDRFVSMSDMKFNAITSSGITIKERVPIPAELIPKDAAVEMEAKKAAGYYTEEAVKADEELKKVKGRDFT